MGCDPGRDGALGSEDLGVHLVDANPTIGQSASQSVHERVRPADVERAVERHACRVESIDSDVPHRVVVDAHGVGRARLAVPDVSAYVAKVIDPALERVGEEARGEVFASLVRERRHHRHERVLLDVDDGPWIRHVGQGQGLGLQLWWDQHHHQR